MDLRPFRAWRYDAGRVALGDVVAPPYDVIDDAQRDALYARSPHNVIRLILNRDADRYASAARHLAHWTETGLLRQEDEPALWLYAQRFPQGSGYFERTGVIGTVRLEPFSSGHIRPHERTLSAPKEDRMRLLEACQTNLSPIFGLYADRANVLQQARAAAPPNPEIDLTDECGIHHRAWRLSDPALVERITSALGTETIFIADGHHRYETALAYRDRLRAMGACDEDDPANFIMMYLCSMDDPGLLVLPTHRIVRGLARFDPTAFLRALQRDFRVAPFADSPVGRRELLAQLESGRVRGQFGVVVRGADALHVISPLADPKRADSAVAREAPELPVVVRQLDVTMLDRLILRRLLHLDADVAAGAGQLRYTHEATEAFDSVASGDAQIAFLLGPPNLADVQAVCLSGETMPQKSTYFYPKLLTGLLFHALQREAGTRTSAAACARTG